MSKLLAARSHLSSTLRRKPLNLRCCFSTVRMSSSTTPTQFIEHVFLFNVKPDADPSAVNAIFTDLNKLLSVPSALHGSAGPVSRCRSNSLTFTHMLHSRYRPKIRMFSSPIFNRVSPVVDDDMVVEWIADGFSDSPVVSPGSALRLTVLKMKEGAGESGKSEVLRVVRGVKDKFGSIEQLTAGETFRPHRAKGFSIASISVFKGVKEMEALESESEIVNEQKDMVREFLDDVLVLDYVVGAPVPSPASL